MYKNDFGLVPYARKRSMNLMSIFGSMTCYKIIKKEMMLLCKEMELISGLETKTKIIPMKLTVAALKTPLSINQKRNLNKEKLSYWILMLKDLRCQWKRLYLLWLLSLFKWRCRHNMSLLKKPQSWYRKGKTSFTDYWQKRLKAKWSKQKPQWWQKLKVRLKRLKKDLFK